VAFILILFIVYLAFLAQAETYFAEVWLQLVICKSAHFLCSMWPPEHNAPLI